MLKLPQAHPVIKALRGVCLQDLPKYEAIIAVMQEQFFKVQKHGLVQVNQASIDQFLLELHEEDEVCFDREQAFTVLSQDARDADLVKALLGSDPVRRRS